MIPTPSLYLGFPPVLRAPLGPSLCTAISSLTLPPSNLGLPQTIQPRGTVPRYPSASDGGLEVASAAWNLTSPLLNTPQPISPQPSFYHKPYSKLTRLPFFTVATLTGDAILPVHLRDSLSLISSLPSWPYSKWQTWGRNESTARLPCDAQRLLLYSAQPATPSPGLQGPSDLAPEPPPTALCSRHFSTSQCLTWELWLLFTQSGMLSSTYPPSLPRLAFFFP